MSPDEPAPLKKQDRLKTVEPVPVPMPVKTETIALAKPDEPVEKKRSEPKKKTEKPTRTASAERNVCTRHGMRKVTTHGGRSWRCRR